MTVKMFRVYSNWAGPSLPLISRQVSPDAFWVEVPSAMDMQAFVGLCRQTMRILGLAGSNLSEGEVESAWLGRSLGISVALSGIREMVWDGFHLVAADASFLLAFARTAPEDLRVHVRAAENPLNLWKTLVESGWAEVVGDERVPLVGLYSPLLRDVPHIEIGALQGGGVSVNGRRVADWVKRDAFVLFVRMVDVGRFDVDMMAKHVQEHVWSVRVAKLRVQNVLREIDVVLGVPVFLRTGRSFEIGDCVIHYDVREFEKCFRETGDAREGALRRALQLYRMPFLHGASGVWVERRRRELSVMRGQAAYEVGALLVARGCRAEALPFLRMAQGILAHDPEVLVFLVRTLIDEQRIDEVKALMSRLLQ